MTDFYTYRIKWVSTGMSYYGVRYKENGTVQDLMTTYFTSSTYVKDYIKIHGLPDVVQIRRKFKNAKMAKQWEERVIIRGKLAKSEHWLNKGNNGSFKNAAMDESIRQKISESKIKNNKSKPKKNVYNNGTINRYFSSDEIIPDGFTIGKLASIKMQMYLDNMKNRVLSEESKKSQSEKMSIANKGKPKPEGFGAKLASKTKGRRNHWQEGDKNPAKRDDVRDKISKSWETRRKIIWFTNILTGENDWQYKDDPIKFDLNEWKRGKTASEKSKGFKIYTNGTENKRIYDNDSIPEGWMQGRT